MSDFVFGDVVYPRMRMSYLSIDDDDGDLIPESPGVSDCCCRCRKVLTSASGLAGDRIESNPACKLSSLHVAKDAVHVLAHWMFLCEACVDDLRIFLNIKQEVANE